MIDSVTVAVNILLGLLTGGILLFFLEVMHLEGSVSKEFKEVMNPFYHKLSKYLVFLSYYRFHLSSKPNDDYAKKFIKQIETISMRGRESLMSGRDISYLSASDLEKLCDDINNKIWYVLDRNSELRKNLSIEDVYYKADAVEALCEVFPAYKDHPLDVQLLYETSGKFFNVIWEPVQHCTWNYEYFLEKEKKARHIILFELAFTVFSLVFIMLSMDFVNSIIPKLLTIIAVVFFAIAINNISFVASLSKRIIRSTKSEMK